MIEYPAIISAVKPRERTTQFKILAAIYALGGAITPITVGDIKELLETHSGSKVETNISKKLREYSNYVSVAERTHPLRWKLTDRGLEQLRALSGLDLPSRRAEAQYGSDIGVICALEQPEFIAVVNALGGATAWHEVGDARYAHVYRETTFTTDAGAELKVIGTTATSMGLTAASIVTTQMIMQFRPRMILMVGIAAGTRDGNKQFGDVLVADPSVDYNSGKVVQKDGVRGFLPDPYPIGLNARLRSVLQKYRGAHSAFSEIRTAWTGPLPLSANRLHIGPLGAADQVIDDPSRVLEIQQNWRKLIGVEMETYGVYRACYESPEPKPRFISFKAVCDFAAEKGDSWQEYAAFIAAKFAFSFLRKEWEALWPKP